MRRTLKILSIAGVTFVALTPSIAHANNRVSVALPEETEATCDETIQAVVDDLEERGFFVPWQEPTYGRIEPVLDMTDDIVPRAYPNDYPEGRTVQVSFGRMANEDNLFNSPQFMTTLAAQIMAECSQVGIVSFDSWWEGGLPIGYFSDNTARPFEAILNGDFTSPAPWGFFHAL